MVTLPSRDDICRKMQGCDSSEGALQVKGEKSKHRSSSQLQVHFNPVLLFQQQHLYLSSPHGKRYAAAVELSCRDAVDGVD